MKDYGGAFKLADESLKQIHSDEVLWHSTCSYPIHRLYLLNQQAHSSLTLGSYFSSTNNCSAFNKRKTIIK